MSKTDFFPLLPLRDIVVFPNMIVPLFVGRDKSIKALNEVMKTNKKIVLVAQKNPEIDSPTEKDLYSFGCESKILQLLKLPDGTVKVLVEGIDRVKILECKDEKDYMLSKSEIIKDKIDTKDDLLPLAIAIVRKLEKLTNLNKKVSFELMSSIKDLKDPAKIADHISSQLNISIIDKQKLLETIDLKTRLEKLMEHINNEINVISVEKRIRGRVKNQMEKTQREYYLNEQMKAIQRELGEIEDGKDEIANLEGLDTDRYGPLLITSFFLRMGDWHGANLMVDQDNKLVAIDNDQIFRPVLYQQGEFFRVGETNILFHMRDYLSTTIPHPFKKQFRRYSPLLYLIALKQVMDHREVVLI